MVIVDTHGDTQLIRGGIITVVQSGQKQHCFFNQKVKREDMEWMDWERIRYVVSADLMRPGFPEPLFETLVQDPETPEEILELLWEYISAKHSQQPSKKTEDIIKRVISHPNMASMGNLDLANEVVRFCFSMKELYLLYDAVSDPLYMAIMDMLEDEEVSPLELGMFTAFILNNGQDYLMLRIWKLVKERGTPYMRVFIDHPHTPPKILADIANICNNAYDFLMILFHPRLEYWRISELVLYPGMFRDDFEYWELVMVRCAELAEGLR